MQPVLNSQTEATLQRGRYRYGQKEYWTRYGQLVQRDGEQCQECARTPPLVKLEIDHIDGKIWTWNIDTQRLLCKACNTRLQRQAPIRERERIPDWQAIQPETESEVRRTKLPAFKRAILTRLITDQKPLTWSEAQFTLSQQVQIASNTADRWIRELARPYNLNGPFVSSWENPKKGPRYKILTLADNYTQEGPE